MASSMTRMIRGLRTDQNNEKPLPSESKELLAPEILEAQEDLTLDQKNTEILSSDIKNIDQTKKRSSKKKNSNLEKSITESETLSSSVELGEKTVDKVTNSISLKKKKQEKKK